MYLLVIVCDCSLSRLIKIWRQPSKNPTFLVYILHMWSRILIKSSLLFWPKRGLYQDDELIRIVLLSNLKACYMASLPCNLLGFLSCLTFPLLNIRVSQWDGLHIWQEKFSTFLVGAISSVKCERDANYSYTEIAFAVCLISLTLRFVWYPLLMFTMYISLSSHWWSKFLFVEI